MPGHSFDDVAVARLTPDGSPDPTFNPGDGHAFIVSVNATAAARLPNGDLVIAGSDTALGSTYGDLALARFTPNGRPDLTFGGGTGQSITPPPAGLYFSGFNTVAAVSVLPNGNLLVGATVGNASVSEFAAAEYLPDGHPDRSFGRGGVITTPLPGNVTAAALGVLPGGKFVIAGTTTSGFSHSHFILVRYYPNGTVDNTFGSGGISIPGAAPNATAHAMAVLPGGKLLVAGSIGPDFGVVRFNADGSLDKSVGKAGTGVVTTDFLGANNSASGIALLPGGKFLLAGTAGTGATDPFEGDLTEIALVRYNADGTLDATFGSGPAVGKGRVVTQAPNAVLSSASAVGIQPDGKIVIAGDADVIEDTPGGELNGLYLPVIRYNPNGSLDTSFGQGGTVFNPSYTPQALIVQPGGKIDLLTEGDIFQYVG